MQTASLNAFWFRRPPAPGPCPARHEVDHRPMTLDPKPVRFVRQQRQRPSWAHVAKAANKAGYRTVRGNRWDGANLRQQMLATFPDEPWCRP